MKSAIQTGLRRRRRFAKAPATSWHAMVTVARPEITPKCRGVAPISTRNRVSGASTRQQR